jgi:DNA polymerase-3 subunit delta
MVALKANEVQGFLQKPGDRFSIILVYGPDDGLVTERASQLVRTLTKGVDDPFSVVRLDAQTVTQDPARLIDEATTVSLFGGKRVIWLRESGGRTNIQPALTPLFDHPDPQSVIVVEAGDLKKGTGIRKRAEDSASAVTIPCYADAGTEIAQVIAEETSKAGLTIDQNARAVLESLLGADRMATRGEVRKLCLYAHGEKVITEDHVRAIVGDASAFAMDELVDAVASGDPATADRVYQRLTLSGTHCSVVGGALIRHMHLLQRLRSHMDAGMSASEATERAHPPLFFKRKAAVSQQLGFWPQARISRALAILDEAMLTSRQKATIGEAALSSALIQLARAARAARRPR